MSSAIVKRSALNTYVQAIAPDGNRTTTQTSAAFDTKDALRATVIVNAGVITDGTFTVSLTSSDTEAGSYTAETSTLGTLSALTSSNDDEVHAFDIDLRGSKRWIKVVVTASGSPATGGKFGVVVELAKRNPGA